MSALPQTVNTPAIATTTPSNALERFDGLDMAERLSLIQQHWKNEVVATTSFGAQSVVLLHLLKNHAPQIPIICIDTGYFFPETYEYAEQLIETLDIDVKFYTSPITPARMENTLGRLWELDDEGAKKYGLLRKVEPLNRALKELGAKAWISGVRRAHSNDRSKRTFIEQQKATTKIFPILDWSDDDVNQYIEENQLPTHPLLPRGFVSIGDWHSTRKLEAGMTSEQTRIHGNQRECGMHLDSDIPDFQI